MFRDIRLPTISRKMAGILLDPYMCPLWNCALQTRCPLILQSSPQTRSRQPFPLKFSSLGNLWNLRVLWTQLLWRSPPKAHIKGISFRVGKKKIHFLTLLSTAQVVFPSIPRVAPSFSVLLIGKYQRRPRPLTAKFVVSRCVFLKTSKGFLGFSVPSITCVGAGLCKSVTTQVTRLRFLLDGRGNPSIRTRL